jgi:hypothetical protein
MERVTTKVVDLRSLEHIGPAGKRIGLLLKAQSPLTTKVVDTTYFVGVIAFARFMLKRNELSEAM